MTIEKMQKQIEGTMFAADLSNTININGKETPRAVWNLLLSIRDVSLFTKGIKPHRFWKLRDVKNYYGVTGGKEKVLAQLQAYKTHLLGDE